MTAYKLFQKYLCLRKRLRRLKERVTLLEAGGGTQTIDSEAVTIDAESVLIDGI